MLRLPQSTNAHTGSVILQDDAPLSYLGGLVDSDLEWEPIPPYYVERAKLREAYEAQCRLEDEQTEAFLASARATMHAQVEQEQQEIEQEARGLASEVVLFERAYFRQLRGGRGFRPRYT